MKTIKKALSVFLLTVFWISNISVFNNVYADYYGMIDPTINELQGDLTKDATQLKWADAFNNQILSIMSYIVDIFIAAWIAVAFFWAYKIMSSEKEETTKQWIRLVLFWVIWVIIMVSASFIANLLVGNWGDIIWKEFKGGDPDWVEFAQNIYEKLVFPFIKIALYLVVGFLFFVTVAKTITYATSTDESAKKKAWWVIIWCAVWVLIVLWAKQLVEAIMGEQSTVMQGKVWVDEMWNKILEFESIPLIAQVVNWVLWITTFIILVLIVVQAYKMFTKPDDPKNRESLKKTILYIIIWVLVIGAAYVISNVLVINKLSALWH